MRVLEEHISNTADAPRVLVADDNAEMRAFVRRLLADHYRVEVVADGQAALDAARARVRRCSSPTSSCRGWTASLSSKPFGPTPRSGRCPCWCSPNAASSMRASKGSRPAPTTTLNKPFSPRELRARSPHEPRARPDARVRRTRRRPRGGAARIEPPQDEFLSMLAHELRNPLAPLGYGIDLLAMPNVPPEAGARPTRDDRAAGRASHAHRG